jgi:hypothetical protein
MGICTTKRVVRQENGSAAARSMSAENKKNA